MLPRNMPKLCITPFVAPEQDVPHSKRHIYHTDNHRWMGFVDVSPNNHIVALLALLQIVVSSSVVSLYSFRNLLYLLSHFLAISHADEPYCSSDLLLGYLSSDLLPALDFCYEALEIDLSLNLQRYYQR